MFLKIYPILIVAIKKAARNDPYNKGAYLTAQTTRAQALI